MQYSINHQFRRNIGVCVCVFVFVFVYKAFFSERLVFIDVVNSLRPVQTEKEILIFQRDDVSHQ